MGDVPPGLFDESALWTIGLKDRVRIVDMNEGLCRAQTLEPNNRSIWSADRNMPHAAAGLDPGARPDHLVIVPQSAVEEYQVGVGKLFEDGIGHIGAAGDVIGDFAVAGQAHTHCLFTDQVRPNILAFHEKRDFSGNREQPRGKPGLQVEILCQRYRVTGDLFPVYSIEYPVFGQHLQYLTCGEKREWCLFTQAEKAGDMVDITIGQKNGGHWRVAQGPRVHLWIVQHLLTNVRRGVENAPRVPIQRNRQRGLPGTWNFPVPGIDAVPASAIPLRQAASSGCAQD